MYILLNNIFSYFTFNFKIYSKCICTLGWYVRSLISQKSDEKKRNKKTQDALTYGGAQEEMEDFKKYLRISKSLFVKAEGTYNQKDRLHFYYLQKNKKVKEANECLLTIIYSWKQLRRSFCVKTFFVKIDQGQGLSYLVCVQTWGSRWDVGEWGKRLVIKMLLI